MSQNLPQDPVILLSVINTKLRDFYSSLDAFCEDKDISREELVEKLSSIDYQYDTVTNQFV